LAALGNLYIHGYAFGWYDDDRTIDDAVILSERAVELDQGSQLARSVRAFVHLLQDDLPAFRREAEVTLDLNPSSPYYVGMIGYLMAGSGDFERGSKLVHWAIDTAPRHPNWLHQIPFLEAWRVADYEAAAQEMLVPGPRASEDALRACALIRLGKDDQAAALIQRIREREPAFATRVSRSFRQVWKAEPFIDEMVAILGGAGLKLLDD
jgi:hypothetical protein